MIAPDCLGSVIIPAHNEATVIGRCLDSLVDGLPPGALEVIVACNGCTDGTEDVVRESRHQVRLVSSDKASKAAALRAGEDSASIFPRLYLDADIVIQGSSVRAVLDCLRNGQAMAARPPISYDLNSADFLVRSYYRARVKVPSLLGSLWGAGLYGLSDKGRARFESFPDLIGDDLFVDQCFAREEILIVDCPPVVVSVPRRTRDLIRVLRRTYQGNAQNRAAVAAGEDTSTSTFRELAKVGLTDPRRALDVMIYLSLAVIARLTLRVAPPASWERDNSSRETAI